MVASLDRGHLGILHRARMQQGADRLGDDATKDFALLHIFDIAPALIRQPTDLLRVLLRKHHRAQRLPRILDDRLIHLLRRRGAFDSWPLEAIVPDRDAFFSFLQERWPLFLDRLAGNAHDCSRDASESFGLKFDGPADLPFDHDDVRVYIDNLFVEGMLSAVSHEAGHVLRGTWVAVGVQFDPEADKTRRLDGLMEAVGAGIPDPDARHHEWAAFAYRWAELDCPPIGSGRADAITDGAVGDGRADRRIAEGSGSVLSRMDRAPLCGPPQPAAGPAGDGASRAALPRKADRAWFRRQGSAHRRGRARPRSVDRAPRRSHGSAAVPPLSRRRRIRLGADHHVRVPAGNLRRKAAVLFSVEHPHHRPGSVIVAPVLGGPRRDGAGGRLRQGAGRRPLDGVSEILSRTNIRALGLVVDKVDKIMHGMVLGTAGMHNQVRQWAGEGFMAELLDLCSAMGSRCS